MMFKYGAGLKRMGSIVAMFAFWSVTAFMHTDAFAHFRQYVWTENYNTLPKNGIELEYWTTLKVPDLDESNANEIEYKGEIEYGVTDHLTLAHYQRWETVNQAGEDKDTTKYSGFKFEGKYRIGEKGKYFVDPLIYLELARDPREEDVPLEIEGKIVLSKDINKVNVTYNQIMESELGKDGRTTHEFSFGMNYEILPEFRFGMEFTGEIWAPSSNRNELALGPTLAYESKYFWVATGFLFGVNNAADDMDARIIVGVPF